MMENYLDEENRKANPRPYRINIGDIIKINRQDITYNNRNYTFYSTTVPIRNSKREITTYKKNINFKLGVEVSNGTYIKINNMREKARINKKDKYEPVWFLFISDFDIVPIQDVPDEEQSLKEYQKQIEDSKVDVDVGF